MVKVGDIVIYSYNDICDYYLIERVIRGKYNIKNNNEPIINVRKGNIKNSFDELNGEEVYELLINKAGLGYEDLIELGYGIPKELKDNFILSENDIINKLLKYELENEKSDEMVEKKMALEGAEEGGGVKRKRQSNLSKKKITLK